ncbi:MAG: type II toxin-antitoxin system Phd/YefM family antitoxin [Alkalispirochaeta sp.]
MNLQADIRPISYVKSNAAEMLRQVNESHNPIVITQNGEAKAVLLDTASFQEMKDALSIMKLISQSEHAFQHDKTLSHEDAMLFVRNRINTET